MSYPWADSDYDDSDFDDDQGQQQQQQAQQANPVRKQLRKLERERDELKKRLEELEKQTRAEKIKKTVEDKGYDPKVANLIPANVEDVEKWLDENSDVLARKQSGDQPGTQQQQDNQPAPPNIPPEIAKALGLISQTSEGISLPPGPLREADVEAKIKATNSPEELIELLSKLRDVPLST